MTPASGDGEDNLISGISSKVRQLEQELETLQKQNDEVALKYETANSFQGFLYVLVIGSVTLFGALIGFGFLSIFTGIAGFYYGVKIAAMMFPDRGAKIEYEQRKLRIIEIKRILSQVN